MNPLVHLRLSHHLATLDFLTGYLADVAAEQAGARSHASSQPDVVEDNHPTEEFDFLERLGKSAPGTLERTR